MPTGSKFFQTVTEPIALTDQEKTMKFRDMIGGGNTSYGQKAGEKDGLKISYGDGSSPNLPLYAKW